MYYRIDDDGRVIERHDNQDGMPEDRCIQSDTMLDDLTDGGGRYRYAYNNGTFTERSNAEKDKDFTPPATPITLSEINTANIDYLAMMTGVEL